MMFRGIRVLAVVTLLVLAGCTPEERENIEAAASEAAGQVRDAAASAGGDEAAGTDQGDAPEPEPAEPEPAPEPEPEPEPEPAPEEDSEPLEIAGLPWWLFVVLLLLIVLVISWIVSSARRSSQQSAARRQQLARTREQAVLETDWLLAVASEQPTAVDAAPRARDIRVRTDRLTDALRTLESRGDRRTAELAAELRTDAVALAQSTIARLDDVAAGRQGRSDLGVSDMVERTRAARDRFVEA